MWWLLIIVIGFFVLYGVAAVFADMENWFLRAERGGDPIVIGRADEETAEFIQRRLRYIAREQRCTAILVLPREAVLQEEPDLRCVREDEIGCLREFLERKDT